MIAASTVVTTAAPPVDTSAVCVVEVEAITSHRTAGTIRVRMTTRGKG